MTTEPIVSKAATALRAAGYDSIANDLEAHALRAVMPQPAPHAMTDERAAFEAWFTENDTEPRMKKRAVERDSNGQYILMAAASAWNVWQARSALAQPDAGEQA